MSFLKGWLSYLGNKIYPLTHAESVYYEDTTVKNVLDNRAAAKGTGDGSLAGVGQDAAANGICSVALGKGTSADDYNTSLGKYPKAMTRGIISSYTYGTALSIGNGTSSTTASNCFRVDYNGSVYGLSAYNSTGADYSEFFEWLDGNTSSEDRRGLFVTLDGNKIKVATGGDYVLGVVSANPCIIGNSDEGWQGRFLKDDYGSFVIGENGLVENPNYDRNKDYVQRADRPEWACIGLLGVLVVRDDGTCQVNSFCKLGQNGLATASDDGYRVIERVNDNLVKFVFK